MKDQLRRGRGQGVVVRQPGWRFWFGAPAVARLVKAEKPADVRSKRSSVMRSGKMSRTAQFVAFNRALGTLAPQVPGFSDPIAVELLPAHWQKRVEKARRSLAQRPGRSPYPFLFTLWFRGMGIFNQFRTVVLDQALTQALPIEQIVILGAGLDSRAWRLDGLKATTIFEVDHPATQAWKCECSRHLLHKAKEVRFVATDFQEETLGPLLRDAGFDLGQRTFWLWEGVTMYLRPEEVTKNIAMLTSLSAKGSHLALTYMRKVNGRVPRSLYLALLGEPQHSGYSPDEIASLLAAHGWVTESDSGIEDWLRQMTPGLKLTRRQVGLQWFERIWAGELRV